MGILRQQVIGACCDGSIGEDVVVGVCGDDAKLEGGRNPKEISAGEFGQVHEPGQLAPSGRSA